MKNQKEIYLPTAQETIAFGESLAKFVKPGMIFCLTGNLGAGKTTLVQGLAKGLKVKKTAVNSPTFVLMNIYEGRLPIYHFDLYRLDNKKEIALLGYEEFLFGDGLAVVEWSEKLGSLMPPEYLQIALEHVDSGGRKVVLTTVGKEYAVIVK